MLPAGWKLLGHGRLARREDSGAVPGPGDLRADGWAPRPEVDSCRNLTARCRVLADSGSDWQGDL